MVTTVSEAAEPLELADGVSPRRAALVSLTAARLMVASVDAVVVGMSVVLIGFSVYTSVLAGLLWATLMAATAPVTRHGASHRGVNRTVVACALICWASAAFLDVPLGRHQFVILLACAAIVGHLSRALGARLLTSPVRVVVVGEIGDREAVARDAHRLGSGLVRAVDAVGPDGLSGAVARHRPDAILVVPGPGFAGREVQRITWEAEQLGVRLLVSTRLHDVAIARTAPMRLGTLSLLQVSPAQREGALRVVKRGWERLAAGLLLLGLALPMAAIALAIRVDSRGPALFRQVRIGRGGRPFTILKFRTMGVDAEARKAELGERDGHVLFKMERDPRITRVGAFLRKFSLDELPQLVNVVRGEMALVGPRPCLPAELERYDHDPRRRLAVLPGITGLWQVSGRSDLSWEESVRLDLDYVDNWSLGLDLTIVLRTVRAVLGHSGAY